MKKCLITGGAGLIGSHLAFYLSKKGYKVVIIDDLSSGNIKNIPKGVEFIHESLEKADVSLFEGVDVVFHLAYISGEAVSFYAPSTCFNKNIQASSNVLINCLRAGVKKILFTSSMAVYGNKTSPPFDESSNLDPADPYGLSKVTVEKLIQIYGMNSSLEWSILRLHNVYGPNMNLTDPYRSVISIFINRLLRDETLIIYGNGNQLRAFTYVEDIIPSIAKAGFDSKCNKKIINLGSSNPIEVVEVAKILRRFTNNRKEILYQPARIGEAIDAYTTTQKSIELLNFKDKTPLESGLLFTLNWAKDLEKKEFNYDKLTLDLDLNNSLPMIWKNKYNKK